MAAAAMIGEDQNPGAGLGNVTLSTVCPKIVATVWLQALSSMMVAKMYAIRRSLGSPRHCARECEQDHTGNDQSSQPLSKAESWHRPPAESFPKRHHGWVINAKKTGRRLVTYVQT